MRFSRHTGHLSIMAADLLRNSMISFEKESFKVFHEFGNFIFISTFSYVFFLIENYPRNDVTRKEKLIYWNKVNRIFIHVITIIAVSYQ